MFFKEDVQTEIITPTIHKYFIIVYLFIYFKSRTSAIVYLYIKVLYNNVCVF